MSIARLTKTATLRFSSLTDAADEAQGRVLSAQRRIKGIEDQLRASSASDNDEHRETLAAEIKRIGDRRDHDQASFLQQMRLVTAIRTWLQQVLPSYEFRDVTNQPDAMDFVDGESPDSAVDRCRAQIFRLQGARAHVARSVPPLENLYPEIDAHVATLAARGRPLVTVVDGKLVVRHDKGDGWGGGAAREAVAVAAWLHPEAMREKLRQRLDDAREAEVVRGVAVMPVAERDRKLADLDRQILALEREEEHYVQCAEEINMTIVRRENANPLAILCLSLHRRKAAAA